MALAAALVLSPFSAAGGASAAKKDMIVSVEGGKLVNLDKPHKPVHCLLWAEGKKMWCFSTEEKADAHAAKMNRAKRLVEAGRASEVEPGVAAASCDIEAVFYAAINYLGDRLNVCVRKANLTEVCDDLTGQCGLRWNDRISSIKPDTAYGWCTHVYPAAYYKQTASLPYLRGTCRNVPDLRDKADYSTGWIMAENWNDVISSVENY